MSTTTTSPNNTRRALSRPRPSLSNAASSPNLSAAYNSQQLTQPGSINGALSGLTVGPRGVLARKASVLSLTRGSLTSIPDASEGYGLDADSPTLGGRSARMAATPGRYDGAGDLEVGDLVDVPGNMHGVVKFLGNVRGKNGTFAGVELSEQFASRGKNNGDVDG
jgi:hypothetical protein